MAAKGGPDDSAASGSPVFLSSIYYYDMTQGSREAAVTDLLRQWSSGDREAAEKVLPLVYDELRRIAASQLRQERSEHTLQATAIVHEAYLRLSEQSSLRGRAALISTPLPPI